MEFQAFFEEWILSVLVLLKDGHMSFIKQGPTRAYLFCIGVSKIWAFVTPCLEACFGYSVQMAGEPKVNSTHLRYGLAAKQEPWKDRRGHRTRTVCKRLLLVCFQAARGIRIP